jgi:hypothetical protein
MMKKILLAGLAILLIIEEWLWDALNALSHLLIKWTRLEPFECWLSQRTPKQALVAFSIPLMIVMPLNIIAISLLARGMILQGLMMEVFVKLLATLLVARVFALTKPQLLSFSFFRSIYLTITQWLKWAHDKVVDAPIYIWIKAFKVKIKARAKAWLY